MLKIRVSFDNREEADEAYRVIRMLQKCLSKKYTVDVNRKIYWNLRDKKKQKKGNVGGRIYVALRPRPDSRKRTQ
jgi:hypothetical protein